MRDEIRNAESKIHEGLHFVYIILYSMLKNNSLFFKAFVATARAELSDMFFASEF